MVATRFKTMKLPPEDDVGTAQSHTRGRTCATGARGAQTHAAGEADGDPVARNQRATGR